MRVLPLAWKLMLASLAVLPLAACDSPPDAAEAATNIGVVTGAPASAMPARTARPVPAPTAPRPTPIPRSLGDMRPRKTFVDPPLPAELLDDGELRPLPPRPTQ